MKKQLKGRIKRAGSVPKATIPRTKESGHLEIEDACPCGYDGSVPWWLPLCVTMVTMVARVTYVISPYSYWVLHPDEVYQSIEVSFSQVYGYGFRPYEYLSPPDTNSTSPFMQHTLKSGMYALRSFMFPHVFTAVLYVFKFLHLNSNPYLTCRIFNAIVTSTLPLAVYHFTRKIFRCRLLAFLSCAMAASGLQITVFGTRPLINSFISPLVFIGLTLCLDKDRGFHCVVNKDDKLYVNESSSECNGNVQRKQNNFRNGNIQYDVNQPQTPNLLVNENQNISELNGKDNCKAFTSTTCQEHSNCVNIPFVRPFLGGFILGTISYVRIDTVLFCGVVLLPIWILRTSVDLNTPKHIFTKNVLTFFVKILFGACVAIFVCVLDDTYQYGFGTLSPVQWFKFNVVSGKASFIFGNLDPKSYAAYFIEDKTRTSYLTILILVSLYNCRKKDSPSRNIFLALLLSTGVLILIYSSIGHKEERFLYNVYVLYAIVLAAAFHYLMFILKDIGVNKMFSFAVICLPISTELYTLFSKFPMVENRNVSKWNYGSAMQSRDLNLCLEYLGQYEDVNGVLINGSIYDIGGYSILQHNVPIIVKVHYEYNLYESNRSNSFSETKEIKVLNDFQDFFHQTNYLYISKLFRNDKRFNYIISQSVPKDLDTNLNFTITKHCGTFKIYRRETEKPTNRKTVFGRYPAGNNATVLEYEASWLLTHGMYTKAVERIQRALELDRSRIRLFQQIVVCYEKLGLFEESRRYQIECYREHGREKCRTQQEKVVLHNEYKRFDVQH